MNRSRTHLGYVSAGLLLVAAVGVFWWDLTRGIRYGPIWASSLLFTALVVYSVTAGPFSEYLDEYDEERELNRGRDRHFDEEKESISRTSYTQRDEEKYIIEPLEDEGWEHLTPNQEGYPDWAKEIAPEDIVLEDGPVYEYAHYDVTGFFVYMITSTVQETPERFDGTHPDDSGFHVFRKPRIRYMSKGELLLFAVMGLLSMSILLGVIGSIYDILTLLVLSLIMFGLSMILFILTIIWGLTTRAVGI